MHNSAVNEETKKSPQTMKPSVEHTCSHCLYFHAVKPGRRPLKGNCSHHKEWIEHASLYTCSEMSALSLKPKGIYRMETDGDGGWVHVRRETKVRSRLFLIKGGEAERGRKGGRGRGDVREIRKFT